MLLSFIKNTKLLYSVNEIYLNYTRQYVYVYKKDINVEMYAGSKASNLDCKKVRSLIEGAKSKSKPVGGGLTSVKCTSIQNKLEMYRDFKGFIDEIVRNNPNMQVGQILGIDHIDYIKELNIINIVTRDFYMLGEIGKGNTINLNIPEDFQKDCMGAFAYRHMKFYSEQLVYYVDNCVIGKASYSMSTVGDQYRTMRLLTSYYPVAINFSEVPSLANLCNSEGKNLLQYVREVFEIDEENGILPTTNVYGKVIVPAGELYFTTKESIARYLGVKTDYVNLDVLLSVMVAKLFKGFYGLNDNLYQIKIPKKNNQGEVEYKTVYVCENDYRHRKMKVKTLEVASVQKCDTTYVGSFSLQISKGFIKHNELVKRIMSEEGVDRKYKEMFGGYIIYKAPPEIKDIMESLTVAMSE